MARLAARITLGYGVVGLAVALLMLAVMGAFGLLEMSGPWVGAATMLAASWLSGSWLAPRYSRAGLLNAAPLGFLGAFVSLFVGILVGTVPTLVSQSSNLDRTGVGLWLFDYLVRPVLAVMVFGAVPMLVLGGLCGLHVRRRLRAGAESWGIGPVGGVSSRSSATRACSKPPT